MALWRYSSGLIRNYKRMVMILMIPNFVLAKAFSLEFGLLLYQYAIQRYQKEILSSQCK